jgi:hypothetical protein
MVTRTINGLLGLAGTQVNELDVVDLTDSQLVSVIDGLGKYRTHPKYQRALTRVASAVVKKNGRNILQLRQPDNKNMTVKAKFEKRIPQIEDEEIRKGLANGTLTIADYEAFAIKHAGGSDTIQMFKSSDDKDSGVTNLNRGMLGNQEALLVDSIILLSGVNGAPTGDEKADGKVVDYGIIPSDFSAGFYTFKNGQKTFSEDTSLHAFRKTDGSEFQVGEFKLEVPKMIQPSKDIVFDLKLPVSAAANTYFKVILKGVIVVKA